MDSIPKEIQIEIISFLSVKEKHLSFVRYRHNIKSLLSYRLVNKLFRDYSPINKFVCSTIYRNQCIKEVIDKEIKDGNKENIHWNELLQGHNRIVTPYIIKKDINILDIWKESRRSDDYYHYNFAFYPFFGKEIELQEEDKFMLMDSKSLYSYLNNNYGDNWIEKINKEYFLRAIQYRQTYNTHEDTELFYTLFLDQICNMYDDILSLSCNVTCTRSVIKLLISHPIYKTIFSIESMEDSKRRWCLSIILESLSDDVIQKDYINSGFIEHHNLWYILFNSVSEHIVSKYLNKITEDGKKIFSIKYSLDFIDNNYDIIDWERLINGANISCLMSNNGDKKDAKRKLGDIIYKHARHIMNVVRDMYWLRYINLDKLREDKELWKEIIEGNGYKIICERVKDTKILDESTGVLHIKYRDELEEWIIKNINRVGLQDMLSWFSYTPERFIRRLLELFPEKFTNKIWKKLITKENLSVKFLEEHKDKLVKYYRKYYIV